MDDKEPTDEYEELDMLLKKINDFKDRAGNNELGLGERIRAFKDDFQPSYRRARQLLEKFERELTGEEESDPNGGDSVATADKADPRLNDEHAPPEIGNHDDIPF